MAIRPDFWRTDYEPIKEYLLEKLVDEEVTLDECSRVITDAIKNFIPEEIQSIKTMDESAVI